MPALPIHGFVLAGGQSSRMGRDKATLDFQGQPLVEIAVEKLRGFCEDVAIVGNREDLAGFAPVVLEDRIGCGPAAGVEAGLKACRQPWALFLPVDVPLVPESLLRLWCDEALRAPTPVSYLGVQGKQPAFCLLQRERLGALTRLLDGGERRLEVLLNKTAEADGVAVRMYDEYELYGGRNYSVPDEATLQRWFANLNTPGDVAAASKP